MGSIILAVHVVLAIGIVVLVLMQQGKGANMGASFGSGASNTVFGSSGNISFFVKVTSWAIGLFFVTSLLLAWIAQQEYFGQATDVGKLLQTIEGSVAPEADETLPSLQPDESSAVPTPQILQLPDVSK